MADSMAEIYEKMEIKIEGRVPSNLDKVSAINFIKKCSIVMITLNEEIFYRRNFCVSRK